MSDTLDSQGRTVSSSPPPEITFGGTEETETRALAAVWEIVLREKAKREESGS